MSEAGNSAGRSWLSNGSYPAQSGTGPDAADSSHRPDVPTPAERISGIVERYGDRVYTPISETHGRKLREEGLMEPVTVERSVETGENEEVVVSETVEREAVPLVAAISEMLEWYEGYRDRSLRMGRGSEVRGDHESFLVDMDNSFTPAYQSKQYARLNAFKRQFIGGEYPNGETVEGLFAEPVTVLFSFTSSSLRPDGTHRPMVDHDREIRDAWSGSSGSVKRTLRYVLEDALGLEPGEYAWWWQSEPHPGPQKAATGYSHSHPVVVYAGAAGRDGAAATDPETYRPVVAKHVAECDGAGWEAHGLDDAVSVREADEIEDFASYVAEYLSVALDDDLLERSDEYLMWAASQWATTTQKYSRSKWATAAVKADACQQEYMDAEAEQTVEHGESVVRAAPNTSHRFECAECGSPHGIDQSEESLARHRLEPSVGAQTARTATAATDGGEVVGDDADGDGGRTEYEEWRAVVEAHDGALSARWRSARSAGRFSSPVREPGEAGEVQTEAFDREPSWKPEAVVQTASGDETVIGSPGGTAYGEIVVEGAESITERSPLPYLPPPSVLEGPEPWRGTDLFDESDVRLGRVPPPELVAREVAEATQMGRRVTPKEWRSDWYARRFERESESVAPDDELELSERDRRRVEELVRTEGVTSIPSVLGRLGIDPSHREEVADVIEECR